MDFRTPIAAVPILLVAVVLAGPAGRSLVAQGGPDDARPLERLQAEDRSGGDLFACALALSEGRLLIGSLFDDDRGPDSGSAYVFDLGPDGWVQSAKLLGGGTGAGDRFGFSVDLAADGNRALIGAPLFGAGGAAYRFDRIDGAWRQTARWAAGEAGADAGAAVALVGAGRAGRALVGAPLADAGGRVDSGAVLAFRLAAAGDQPPVRLEAATPRAGAGLGWSVAGSGPVVAAGAPWADAPFTGAGTVTLFTEGPGGFRVLAELPAPDATPFQAFGYSLDLAGDLLVVGAPRDGERGPGAGAVYVFRVREGRVVLETKIPGTVAGDQYGTAVAVSADGLSFAVGARGGDGSAGADVGYVDLFERFGDGWVSERRIQPAGASAGDEVGIDVSLAGRGIAVGAYRDDGGGVDAGAAYVSTPAADLAVAKRLESPDPADHAPAPGEGVVFVVEVENRGPDDAFGARVLDPPPDGLSDVAWTCEAGDGARCTPAGTGTIDDRVDLPAGSAVTYRVTGTVSQAAAGELVNRVSVEPAPGLFDPDPGNGADEVETPVGPPRADLSFDVRFVSGRAATPGREFVHEVEIANRGPSDAPTLGFSGGGLGPAFTTPTWTCAPSGGADCTSGPVAGPIVDAVTLPAGSRVVYTLRATAPTTATGALVLAGTLGPLAGLDPDPSDNSDRVETPLVPQTDLAASLSGPAVVLFSVSPARGVPAGPGLEPRQEEDELLLRPGETAHYEATITSSGPSHATAAAVRALLPAGLAGAGWSCRDAEDTELASAEDGVLDARIDLPVHAVVVCSFTVEAVEGFLGSRPVAVEVLPERAFEDPDPSDNRAEARGPVLLPDDALALTLEAFGTFVEGSPMSYELLVANGSQTDPASLEVILPIPEQLEVITVEAEAGEAGVASPSEVVWTLDLPSASVARLRVEVRIRTGTLGSEVSTQAFTETGELGELLDPMVRSSPPGVPEPAPTIFVVQGALDVPTASQWGLAMLALLLAGSALGLLQNRRTA